MTILQAEARQETFHMDTGAAKLESAIKTLSDSSRPFSDSDLGQPYQWEAHAEEGVRFGLLGTAHELRTLAVQLAALRRAEGPPLTRAQHALAQYNSAYRDLLAVLAFVTEEEYDRKPEPGEWGLRHVLGHMVGVERNFYALVDYGWRRQQTAEELPAILPAGEANRLFGEYAEFGEIMDQGSMADMLAYYETMHDLALTRFAAITDAELDGPSIWWEDIPYSLEYRLHRFDAHLRQHTIQIEKTLAQLGHSPTEAERLLRVIYAALAEVEASLIGAADLGLTARQAQAERIRHYADDMTAAVNRARELGTAVKQGNLEHVRKLLADDPLLVNATADAEVPMVRVALYYNQPDTAAFLIEAGAHLGIHDAAALGRTVEVEALLVDEGDWLLDEFSRDGYTALQLACFFGRADTALLLLDRGANPNLVARNSMEIQAIHAAAAAGQIVVVEALLTKGADANAQQQGGFRPLHTAAQNGDVSLAQLLIAHGADAALTNTAGQTPGQLAHAAGHDELAALLKT